MNKAKLAQRINHTLKAASFQKNVIKGMGWKGHGHRYYTGGFNIGTKQQGCVMVSYRLPHEMLPLNLSMVDDGQLTDYGKKHKQKIQSETRRMIDEYKAALSDFCIEEKADRFELPYLKVTS